MIHVKLEELCSKQNSLDRKQIVTLTDLCTGIKLVLEDGFKRKSEVVLSPFVQTFPSPAETHQELDELVAHNQTVDIIVLLKVF